MNKVILMGRLVADPELRYTQSNLPVTSIRLAVDRPFSKQGQERQADFFDVVCWRHTAEFVSRYFTKGQRMAVSGYLQNRKWQDKQGNDRWSTEVVADDVYFADGKRDAGQGYNQGYGAPPPHDDYSAPPARGGYSSQGGYGGSQGSQSAPGTAYSSPATDFEVITEDDGLPF
ncbi:MAG: single-stranded DNA-binding protein [Clostridia bacterium]|nr:single-stranded DNA-binding protein [Clostridia bacterium]MBQ3077099.1 single-stranded DNA-binding protein [Clostridia bacterium]